MLLLGTLCFLYVFGGGLLQSLADLVVQGAQALGAVVRDFGLLTTPQLHHVVRMSNSTVPGDSALATEEGYYTMLATAYKDILQVCVVQSGKGILSYD